MDAVDAAGFPRKYGAVWTSIGGSQQSLDFLQSDAAIEFGEREQPGVDRDYTYHVDRGLFDQILLQNAERLGAKVFLETRVLNVDFDDPDKVIVTSLHAGQETTSTARMLVDASGRQTLLGRQLRVKVPDPVFDQYALHTWFEGLDRSALATE